MKKKQVIINQGVLAEFKKIESYSTALNINETQIFQEINLLDSNYSNDEYYILNIDGILGNLAHDRKSESLSNFAIYRLKKKLQNKEYNEENIEKFNYDLGVIYGDKANRKYPYPRKVSALIDAEEFNEARNFYNNVNGFRFSAANTNQAIILNQFGRNFEAILLYDKVLGIDNNFGMALGNKASALEYYYQLSSDKNIQILEIVRDLYSQALGDANRIQKIGGITPINLYSKKLNCYNNYLKQVPQSLFIKNEINTTSYENFVLMNNLFLNFHFGLLIDEHSLQDSLFPRFLQKTESTADRVFSDNMHHAIKGLNQIHEDFIGARYLFYEWQTKDVKEYDKKVSWIYTFDFSKNSIKHGILKLIAASLYNILDKVARVILTYFRIKKSSEKIYLSDLKIPEFKNIVIQSENFQLLALYNLSKDFHEGKVYNTFQKLRNKITHESLDIVDFATKENEGYTLDALNSDIVTLFKIVKAALLYSAVSINKETDKVCGNALIDEMSLTDQNDIFSEFDF